MSRSTCRSSISSPRSKKIWAHHGLHFPRPRRRPLHRRLYRRQVPGGNCSIWLVRKCLRTAQVSRAAGLQVDSKPQAAFTTTSQFLKLPLALIPFKLLWIKPSVTSHIADWLQSGCTRHPQNDRGTSGLFFQTSTYTNSPVRLKIMSISVS